MSVLGSHPTEGADKGMSDENQPLARDVERILDEESAFIARPSKAVTVRVALAAYMAAQKKITQTAKDVFARIEVTICETHTMCDDGPRSRREGRISEADFDAITAMFTEAPALSARDGVEGEGSELAAKLRKAMAAEAKLATVEREIADWTVRTGRAVERADAAERERDRAREALDDIEDCMMVRLHGAEVGNEAEKPLATACWGQALRDAQRIKSAALKSPAPIPAQETE